MRTYIYSISFVLILLFCGCNKYNQPKSSQNTVNNLALFCKVWGFLKYYHSDVGGGIINWDSVLVNNIERIQSLHSSDSLKQFFDEIVPLCHETLHFQLSDLEDSIVYDNASVLWIYDTNIFSSKTIKRLDCIYHNSYAFESNYISKNEWVKNPIFDQDTFYNHIPFPNNKIRLLSLFRYWNIINYYYPYKYLTDVPWDSVLYQFIPKFYNATDTIEYHLQVCKLTAMINDNHAYTSSDIIENNYGNRFLPVKFQLVEGRTIIADTYSDSLAELNNLTIGDLIYRINNISIEDIRDSLHLYFSGSDSLSIQNTISYFLSRSPNVSMQLDVCRDDSIFSVICPTYQRSLLSKERKKKAQTKTIKRIDGSIAYVDLSKLNYENVDSIISQLLNYKYLILDLRKNCQFILYELCDILYAEHFIFYSVTTPVYNKPGLFSYRIGDPGGPQRYNPSFYKGELIILINEETQSIGEFTAMALLKHKNSISIGRPTAGADGNVSLITLPGNIQTYISGIGIYWPDGKITQRCGIIPTIKTNQQLQSVANKQDDIMLKAIEYVQSKAL